MARPAPDGVARLAVNLDQLPERDAERVRPPLCPCCGGRMTRLGGSDWIAYCRRRECRGRLVVEAVWMPGRWWITCPD
jgi:hypothetical protein